MLLIKLKMLYIRFFVFHPFSSCYTQVSLAALGPRLGGFSCGGGVGGTVTVSHDLLESFAGRNIVFM